MKKYLLALLAVIPILTACPPKEVLPTSVTLNKTTVTLVEGADFTLQALVNPSDAANKELTWSSSAEAVATVDQTGKVVAVKEGTATITATSKAASSVKGTCAVTVTKKAIPVTAVQLSETEATLMPGETLKVSVVITPSDATDNNVTWASDNNSVATVDANGLITAGQGGVAYITATAGGKTSDALMITVLEPRPLFIRYPSCLLRTGGSITQEVWYGTNWDDHDRDNLPAVTWTSDNVAVAAPEGESGNVIRAIGPGKATISGKDVSGGQISFIVNVEDATDKVYDDYLPGIALVNCHDESAKWACTNGEYALTDGYVDGVPCMGATVDGYKIAEVFFSKRMDVSSIQNPALFIRMYIDDVSKFITMDTGAHGEPIVELRSTDALGTYEEVNTRVFWSLTDIFTNMDDATENAKQTLHSGWNNIVLPFDRAQQWGFNDDYNITNLTYFRIHQMYKKGAIYNPDFKPTVFKFDQIRIIDWTEFDNCDNFAMWRDRPAQQNQYNYVDDTEGKVEGRSCIACEDVLMNGISSYRLETWPGLEYAMPAMYTPEDLAFQCKLYLDDPEVFTQYWNFDFEIASEFTPDDNGFDIGFGPSGEPWPDGIVLKQGWNTIKFNFADYMTQPSDTGTRPYKFWGGEEFNPRKFTYFRLVFTPIDQPKAKVTYHTFKIDDIRIVKK